MPDNPEYAESGQPIYRYPPRERSWEVATGDPAAIEAIEKHITAHIGPVESVFHEIISDLVHLDVHVVMPTARRNYFTLVTSGMSDRPMRTPPGAEEMRYAELLICLPPDWPLSQADMEQETNYWPIRWLKMLARFPHEYDTWLWAHHTLPNGDPAKPFVSNTSLCCAMLAWPALFRTDFRRLQISPEKTIHFLGLIPLYQEEMELKLKRGADPLMRRLEQARVTELLDIQRPNVCKRRFGLF